MEWQVVYVVHRYVREVVLLEGCYARDTHVLVLQVNFINKDKEYTSMGNY